MSTGKTHKRYFIIVAAFLLIAAIVIAMLVGGRAQRIQSEIDLGMQYLEKLEYISARFAFEGVLEIDANNVDAYLGLAEIEYQLGMPEDAFAIIEQALTVVSDIRLEEARIFYADAIPQPDDVIHLDNEVLESVLLYTLGKPDGELLQADLDRVSEIDCLGYRYPQVSVNFEDGLFVDYFIGYDANGTITNDSDAIVTPIELMFDASIARFAEHCRNAKLTLDMVKLDYETLQILPRVRGLDSLTVYDTIADLSLLHIMRRLESITFFCTETTDYTSMFRKGALPSLVSINIIEEGLPDENGELEFPTIDLTGIDALPSIQYIYIESASSVIGLEDAAALPNLTDLCLRVDTIDLKQLSEAVHLKTLRINGCGETILDTTALSGMTELEHFFFYGCQLTDPTALAPLVSLKKLDLSNLGLTDISFLSGMTQMEYLNLNDNFIADISALANMSKLLHLEMNNNQIVDVTPLSEKPQLNELRMENNRITQLSGITGLTKLTYLLMYGNPVTTIEAVRDMPVLYDLRVDEALISDWSPADHVQHINTNNDYWGGTIWK